jgi:hypothetical protein
MADPEHLRILMEEGVDAWNAWRRKQEPETRIGAVADAEDAATRGDGSAFLRYLRNAGNWTLKVAEDFGAAVAVEALKKAMLPGP